MDRSPPARLFPAEPQCFIADDVRTTRSFPIGHQVRHLILCHLLDGDPASNTLSWRWVAGPHTCGKHYVARAENIRRCIEGRFSSVWLNENPAPLNENASVSAGMLQLPGRAPAGDVALLLHLDDLYPESLDLLTWRRRKIEGRARQANDT